MANSATLLAQLLTEWAVPSGKPPEYVRGGANGRPDSPDFWEEHVLAVHWLAEIDDALRSMEQSGDDVEHYREAQPHWYAAVFSQSVPWGSVSGGMRRTIDRANHGLLRALGVHLDAVKYTPRFDGDDLDALRSAIQEANDLVVATSAIDGNSKRLLLGLIAEVSRCLDEVAAFGEVRLRDAVLRLGGALESVAAAMPEGPERSKWSRATHAVLQSIGSAAGKVFVAIATEYAKRQINS